MTISTHLKALQALEMAVRTGSLKAAADKLSITPAAVGQRIKTLEDWLGLDLLVRGRSGIRPTRELEAAALHLAAAFREIDTVTRILDFQRVQEIHVTADTDWAELWLRPNLPAFKAANPNILFCVNGIGDVPIRIGQSDCEIWFGEGRGGEAEDVLFHDYLVPIGSPENTARVSLRPKEERIEGFPLLHLDCYRSDLASVDWPEWTDRYGYRKTASERGIRYAHVVHALEAVYSHAGFLICGVGLVQKQLNDRRISLPFAISEGAWTGHAYHASFRGRAMRRSQVAIFRAWLVEQAKQTEMWLGQLTGQGCQA